MGKKPKTKDAMKRIAIPDVAKAEIIRANQEMNNYLAGVVAGMGIKGRWSVDVKTMQLLVEDNQPRDSKSR